MKRILFITNENDVSSDAVLLELERRGNKVFRLNTEKLCCDFDVNLEFIGGNMLGSIWSDQQQLSLDTISGVFYRRPKFDSGIDDLAIREFVEKERNTFCNWLWTALSDNNWLNHPLSIRRAESKFDQLILAHKLGMTVPRTIVTNDPQKVLDFYDKVHGHMIMKVLRQGFYVKDSSAFNIYATLVTSDIIKVINDIRSTPCIFQEYIDKEYELRITIVDSKIFACKICSQMSDKTKNDWRRYDLANTPHLGVALPNTVANFCEKLLNIYGLRYGAIDMIVKPDGSYVFLELNPNGQWLWIENLTHMPITSAIADALESQ